MFSSLRPFVAEFIGTFLLVFMGCGSAILGGNDIVGVSIAFGLTLLFLINALGQVSGCHINPAVTLCVGPRAGFSIPKMAGYIIAQILGGIAGAFLIYFIASGHSGFDIAQGFALNGFDAHSPKNYSMISCLITEVMMTSVLLYTILTCGGFKKHAGILIGFALIAIHLVSIPVTNTSVNFARTLGVAVVHGGFAYEQLWLFAAAHIIAVIFARMLFAVTHNYHYSDKKEED